MLPTKNQKCFENLLKTITGARIILLHLMSDLLLFRGVRVHYILIRRPYAAEFSRNLNKNLSL